MALSLKEGGFSDYLQIPFTYVDLNSKYYYNVPEFFELVPVDFYIPII